MRYRPPLKPHPATYPRFRQKKGRSPPGFAVYYFQFLHEKIKSFSTKAKTLKCICVFFARLKSNPFRWFEIFNLYQNWKIRYFASAVQPKREILKHSSFDANVVTATWKRWNKNVFCLKIGNIALTNSLLTNTESWPLVKRHLQEAHNCSVSKHRLRRHFQSNSMFSIFLITFTFEIKGYEKVKFLDRSHKVATASKNNEKFNAFRFLSYPFQRFQLVVATSHRKTNFLNVSFRPNSKRKTYEKFNSFRFLPCLLQRFQLAGTTFASKLGCFKMSHLGRTADAK